MKKIYNIINQPVCETFTLETVGNYKAGCTNHVLLNIYVFKYFLKYSLSCAHVSSRLRILSL